jgi:hypothetical protein
MEYWICLLAAAAEIKSFDLLGELLLEMMLSF